MIRHRNRSCLDRNSGGFVVTEASRRLGSGSDAHGPPLKQAQSLAGDAIALLKAENLFGISLACKKDTEQVLIERRHKGWGIR